ncbi:MAG: aminotransferase class III-fold pyridoxal phosphate-dependent enzyme [Phyllobacteriaceae bacterium]|nr:aminotransferase class III-fold pyridoxal phosphate-dependent enzyme [Phyllobacteriaceae bacterium]
MSYWPEIQRICRQYDILLMLDEVITGYGRTGAWFGAQSLGIEADTMTTAKALTSGYMPLSALLVSDRVARVLEDKGGEFYHGYTYAGHPVACAVALKNLEIIEREGPGALAGNPAAVTDIQVLMRDIVSKVPDAQVMGDLDATVRWAGKNGGNRNRVAITGFCWGGRITWLYAAHNPKVRAGIAWYGRLVGTPNELQPKHPVDVVGEMKAPVLGLYGAADTGIPLDTVNQMKAALAAGSAAAKKSEFVVYPEAPHAFHADYRPSFRAAPAQDGWKRCLDWFKANGVA